MAKPKEHQFSEAEENHAELSRVLQSEYLALESLEEDEPATSGETSTLQVNPVSLEDSAPEKVRSNAPRTAKRLVRKL